MIDRPNFLFLITDQQRADWLGCYGHKVVKTPNIDKISQSGTIFENFYTASPVCMPNRASLMTGRYPSLHGLRYNGCILPHRANTFINLLAEAGYETAAFGKSHLQPYTAKAPMANSIEDLKHIKEAWNDIERAESYLEEPQFYQPDEKFEFETPYYGFKNVDIVTSHGDRCGGHYRQWFRQMAPDWQSFHDPKNELPNNYTCPQAYRTPVPEELYPTAYIRDRVVDYIHTAKNKDTPFFAFVSFPDPHHPFNPPGKYWDMYNPDEFELYLPYEAHKNPTPPMRWLNRNLKSGADGQKTPQTALMLDEHHIKEAMALTAGMISFVDDAIGTIMDTLSDTWQNDNTVVCFNSDHGDYLGDFNMILKGALQFKSITRVPFIWMDPGMRTREKTDALCSTVDIASSILDRAGLKTFNGNQGKTFLPALLGEVPLRDEALIEYNDGGSRLGFKEPARVRSIISLGWRYTVYKDCDWGELYDLKSDPDETENLWHITAFSETKAYFAERLNHHLIAQMDESPLADRLA